MDHDVHLLRSYGPRFPLTVRPSILHARRARERRGAATAETALLVRDAAGAQRARKETRMLRVQSTVSSVAGFRPETDAGSSESPTRRASLRYTIESHFFGTKRTI